MTTERQYELNSLFAQRVVDVVAPTLRQNINLMNAHGLIVASTDAERVGAEHRAALEVLETGRPVIVDRELPGVPDKPGVNVPLVLDGRISGVVGVTGQPESVEQVAQVLAMTIALLIEQEREHDSSNEVRTRVRELVAVLSAPSGSASADIVETRLSNLGLGEGPWSIGVWAASEPREDGTAAPPDKAEQLVTAINEGRARLGAVRAAGAVVWRGMLWVVAAGSQLEQNLAGAAARRLVVDSVEDLEELMSWAQDMRALGRLSRLLPPAGWDLSVPVELTVVVAHLPEPTLMRLAEIAHRLSPSLRETVRALAGSPSMAHGARRLYLHRNTLLQRVSRIRALTGLDVRSADSAAVLRLSLAAAEALGNSSTASE